jgi:hypothetical protein
LARFYYIQYGKVFSLMYHNADRVIKFPPGTILQY